MSSKTVLEELAFEKVSTQKLLNRLPEDQLHWQPHPKAMTLGQLAYHVASIPGNTATFANLGETTVATLIEHPLRDRKSEILEKFEESYTTAVTVISATDENWDRQTWSCYLGDKEIITWPRPTLLRFLMLNHWYHHRGELVMYLRTLGVLIPSIYGPSADENPFV